MILAAITQRKRLALALEYPSSRKPPFVLYAKDGLWMRLRARKM